MHSKSLFGLMVAAILTLSSVDLVGQTPDAVHLKGMRKGILIVEGFSKPECGLSADDLKTSASFIVSQSDLKIENSGLEPFALYINVILMDNCSAAAVSLEVLTTVTVDGTGTRVGDASIWGQKALLTGSDERTRILSQVEEFCKKFVVDWNSVNRH
jgi:hypothetical protein